MHTAERTEWMPGVLESQQSRFGLSSHTLQIVAAFAAVYTIWGATYFAIRVAITALPPFLMAGARFLIAGALLYVWLRLRGVARPKLVHWRSALIIGGLLLVGGNGAVSFAEQVVPSGLVALLVAMVPIYIAVLDWLRPGGSRPTVRAALGLLFGLGGIVLLIGPGSMVGPSPLNLAWAAIPLVGSLCWAAGSLYSRSTRLPDAPLLATAMEMLAGGALLLLVALATGEPAQVDPTKFSLPALAAFAFLVVCGSIVAFSAYIWLLRVVAPPRVATYAYVNPVVAIFLGWAFAGEPVSARTLLAAAVIVLAVAIITTSSARGHAKVTPQDAQRGAEAGEVATVEVPSPGPVPVAPLDDQHAPWEEAGAARR
jgi:drug/metabolite transporter (DMT)-like permease